MRLPPARNAVCPTEVANKYFFSKVLVEHIVFHQQPAAAIRRLLRFDGGMSSATAGQRATTSNYGRCGGRVRLKFRMTNADIELGLGSGLPGVTSPRHKELLHA
ncbi:hypothetical protein R69776_04543 [Paraburkholderia nemoris]|uniref:Uncharacterized protein n=1 Tax=Paraburkholderia nemoris TaxID=2793076 RepID=A0ABN7M9R2_9BURK|nr:hypothetical protein R75777_00924 [Paraburkholderia nemoris]CAE6785973.1 hypothetical protein R69776_04543 [Paraburkholderia nemoris]